MRQERLPSPAREFKGDESSRLIDYFLADCSGGKDPKVEEIVGELQANYSAYVKRFVENLNKKDGYTKPRTIVRKLWEAGSLRKCQLLPAFTYADFCVQRLTAIAEFSSWLDQVASTMRATRGVQQAHKRLEMTLQEQASRVDASFVGPGAKSPQLKTLITASDFIQAIDDMERIQTRVVSIRTHTNHLSDLCRMARDQTMGVDHPEHPTASAEDLACILPILEQSVTGSENPPSRNYEVDYSSVNLLKDVSRMTQDQTRDRINRMLENFERIMPGLRERVSFEPYEAIPKQPVNAPLSIDACEILTLSEIHAYFRNMPQREQEWDKLKVLLEGAFRIFQDPNLRKLVS